ncbi:MAG TPA: magnesium transporter [Gemmatimonadales bacterium]|nr:magnesium transporter [Gemmatimonadales bacterium]
MTRTPPEQATASSANAPTPITPELLHQLAADPEELAAAVASRQPADVAEALRELPPDAAPRVLAALPFDVAVQVLDEPHFVRYRTAIVERLDPVEAQALIEAMSGDQQADLVRELTPDARDRLLAALAPASREAVRLLLQYPPDTAGGIMTPELVSVPPGWTAAEVMAHVRRVGETKETIYAIYVADAESRVLQQVFSLRELVMADPLTRADAIGPVRPPLSVGPLVDREEVARLIGKYDLLAMPVVDDAGRLLGVVTIDDVMDALVAEETEDLQKLGGVEAFDEPFMRIGFLRMVRKRAGWLTILFLGEMLTATALGRFEEEIARAVVLVLFIPLIISSGGNSGGQSTSLIIRAMALGEVRLRDWWRVARRDLPAGVSLGSILGTIAVARILLWQQLGLTDYGEHYGLVAATVGTAVLGVVTFGSFTGAMLPFLIRRIGLDPATASAPFVATLVDVTGIIIYFTIASFFLHGTLL